MRRGPGPRLLYVCPEATRPGRASAVHVHAIADGLRGAGWQVDLLEPLHGGSPAALRRLASILALQVRAVMRFRGASVLYVRSHPLALPVAWAAKVVRLPVVQEINGSADDLVDVWPRIRPIAALLRLLMAAQIRTCDLAIGVTPRLAEWASALGAHSTAVVQNGVDTQRFTPGATSRVVDLPQKFVVFVGTLAPWQGLPVLLQAAASSSWPSDTALVVAGDGPERDRVREAAARLSHVIDLGQVASSDVPGIVATSLASVVPAAGGRRATGASGEYRFGLSPLKAFEAMSCGVAVIASDQPGLGDLVQRSGAGIVVKVGDADDLARAVARLAGNPAAAREMGARGRDEAVKLHDWSRRVAQTDRLLREVVETFHR